MVGVVPYLKVDIEDEDSLSQRLEMRDAKSRWTRRSSVCRICPILRTSCRWNSTRCWVCGMFRTPTNWGAPDLILLPGTKNTVDDLLWLRQCGLETALLKLAAKGTPVLGVCGGYQMLGQTLDDPTGSESGRPQTLRGWVCCLPDRVQRAEAPRTGQSDRPPAAPLRVQSWKATRSTPA